MSFAEDPAHSQFVIGSSDGKIRFFEHLQKPSFSVHCLQECDIGLLINKYLVKNKEIIETVPTFTIVSSEPIWKQQSDYLQKVSL